MRGSPTSWRTSTIDDDGPSRSRLTSWRSEPAIAPELEPEALDARALVLRVLARLPERHRSVLVLHDLDGLPVQDIAAVLGVPRFTLYTRIRRARRAFADEVSRLQQLANRRRPVAAMALAPAPLLALEREIPPAPASLHRWVKERLPVEGAAPAAGDVSPATPSPLRGGGSKLLAAGAGLGVALGFLALVRTPSTSAPSAAPAGPRALEKRSTPIPAGPPPPRFAMVTSPAGPDDPVLVPAPAPVPSIGLGRDLVGFWRFDDGPGTTRAADHSGGGFHCQLRGLDPAQAWIPGQLGGAIELGFNGWLECPQPELPRRQTAGLTVAVWVRRGGTPPAHRALAMRPMGPGRGNYFFFGFAGDELKVSSSGWGGALTARLPDATGRWVHVAFTHAPDHTVRLYVDGREVARLRGTPRVFSPVQQPLRVGGGLTGPGPQREGVGQLFEGALDELLVYERALSPDELLALAHGATP